MPTRPKALLVNGRIEVRTLVSNELEEAGFHVVEATDGLAGWQRFRKEEPDLVVSDLRMGGLGGIELLREIRTVSSVPVILLTAHADVANVVAAMKGGAQEFFTFPNDLGRMISRVCDLVGSGVPVAKAEWLETRVAGNSRAMHRIRERIAALAPLKVPVLVCGESGTGRDCIVNALHLLSSRGDTPLISIRGGDPNSLKVPPPGSVVYLDEIGRLEPDEQVRWFEYIREMEKSGPRRVARVYASTSADLGASAGEGSFHPKLSNQLLRFTILLPPLRERIEDLDQIVPIIVTRLGEAMGRERAHIEAPAIEYLKSQPWLGNVRELSAVLEKLVAFSPRGDVTRDRVEQVLGELPASVASIRSRRGRRQREELSALIDSCGGNLAEVARQLSISRGAVIYRAQKYGLLKKPR